MTRQMKRWRVLLADDHDVVLAGLRTVLSDPDFEIVDSVRDGRALVARTMELRPDVIVTDISMPLLNGIDAARQIREIDPRTKIVFLTIHSDIGYATAALSLGNSAYVLKTSVAAELPVAVRSLLVGNDYVSRAIEEPVRRALGCRPQRPEQTGVLTERQREVLQLLAEGKSVKEVAAVLSVSPRTAEYHKYRIMDALGVRSVAELARYAVKEGIVN
jgi:DNA-binding NarL/FixJ family response regulator